MYFLTDKNEEVKNNCYKHLDNLISSNYSSKLYYKFKNTDKNYSKKRNINFLHSVNDINILKKNKNKNIDSNILNINNNFNDELNTDKHNKLNKYKNKLIYLPYISNNYKTNLIDKATTKNKNYKNDNINCNIINIEYNSKNVTNFNKCKNNKNVISLIRYVVEVLKLKIKNRINKEFYKLNNLSSSTNNNSNNYSNLNSDIAISINNTSGNLIE